MISIIVPVYNCIRSLPRCIGSIQSQTLTDWELLLVDDGSTDGSSSLCDQFVTSDNRIHVFHKPNGGVSSARNMGLEHAQGEYVMFCDSEIKKDGETIVCAMTPVVYVKDVDTTYFEGSCGSGTTACAVSFGLMQGDGIHHFVFRQPAGTIESTAHISDGRIEKIYIEGKVELSAETEVEIEV